MAQIEKPEKKLFGFVPMFWLVILFEFFERGSYYGMMSILSVYLTDHLHFAKESVGIIKGTIQPLLYFLPIISGALADRFGYRKTLMVAFSFLGLGYFLTAQATSYALVFGALVIMGIGAGTFKPLISGTIAKVTDEKNSTLGFGIYYWSINLGAFLFPLILVPILKKMDWRYVIIASAIGTATMLIPTIFFYKEPGRKKKKEKSKEANLIQTLANAFEIIYSPLVLLYHTLTKSLVKKAVILAILFGIFAYSLYQYLQTPSASEFYSQIGIRQGDTYLIFDVNRNMLAQDNFTIKNLNEDSTHVAVTINKPRYLKDFAPELLIELQQYPDLKAIGTSDLTKFIKMSDDKINISFERGDTGEKDYRIVQEADNKFTIIVNNDKDFLKYQSDLRNNIKDIPILMGIGEPELDNLYNRSGGRSFFLLYVIGIVLIALGIISTSSRTVSTVETAAKKQTKPFTIVVLFGLILWFLPGLTMLGRIISFIIYITVTSLFIIDKTDTSKFKDHAKFLLMIMLYSGFWILYFQMFDSVLWYVQAYVDAASLNNAANSFLGIFGIHINWFFDIEHVTVINAGTIILLQLIVSNIVKHTKALPTMVVGIIMGTFGMAILAISTDIWVFMAGIILFSIGEMTAHPKFISYIGIIAPTDKKAMYMGYLFLYGVFGSSVGGVMGAKLYVHFVDNLNQPKVLWLIFSLIGVATVIALLLYNKFLADKETAKESQT